MPEMARKHYDSEPSLIWTKNNFLSSSTPKVLPGRVALDDTAISVCNSSIQDRFLCGYSHDKYLFCSQYRNGPNNEQLHTE